MRGSAETAASASAKSWRRELGHIQHLAVVQNDADRDYPDGIADILEGGKRSNHPLPYRFEGEIDLVGHPGA
jgi:hypothetical protein